VWADYYTSPTSSTPSTAKSAGNKKSNSPAVVPTTTAKVASQPSTSTVWESYFEPKPKTAPAASTASAKIAAKQQAATPIKPQTAPSAQPPKHQAATPIKPQAASSTPSPQPAKQQATAPIKPQTVTATTSTQPAKPQAAAPIKPQSTQSAQPAKQQAAAPMKPQQTAAAKQAPAKSPFCDQTRPVSMSLMHGDCEASRYVLAGSAIVNGTSMFEQLSKFYKKAPVVSGKGKKMPYMSMIAGLCYC
jgi:hypothetical protein